MNFETLVDKIISGIFNPLIVLIGGLALIYFLVGVLKYIQSADNEEKRKEGATMMTYGIVALFVMSAVWGLVAVLEKTFNLDNNEISSSSTTETGQVPFSTDGGDFSPGTD